MKYEEAKRHLPKGIPADVKKTLNYMHQHYIFYARRKDGKYEAYCSCCHKTRIVEKRPRQGEKAQCACGQTCIAKTPGQNRKRMMDAALVVKYSKAKGLDNAIVATGYFSWLSFYIPDYKSARIEPAQVYSILMIYGVGAWRYINYWSSFTGDRHWCPARGFGIPKGLSAPYVTHYLDEESIHAAIKETPFERLKGVKNDIWNTQEYYANCAARPCIEYLEKLGYNKLAHRGVCGIGTYRAINWKGKTIDQVLRLPKQQITAAKKAGVELTSEVVKLLQVANKAGVKLDITEAASIAFEYQGDFERLLKQRDPLRVARYLKKQFDKGMREMCCPGNSRFTGPAGMLRTYTDYIDFCQRLGVNVNDDAVRYPGNLVAAHDRKYAQLQEQQRREREEKNRRWEEAHPEIMAERRARELERKKANEKREKEFKEKKLPRLEKQFCYFAMGLLIRPARSGQELTDEGNALHHCVGTYAESHLDGNTIICFIRKADKPDEPFYTCEFKAKDGALVQLRGSHNCAPTPEVEAFMTAFENHRNKKEETA